MKRKQTVPRVSGGKFALTAEVTGPRLNSLRLSDRPIVVISRVLQHTLCAEVAVVGDCKTHSQVVSNALVASSTRRVSLKHKTEPIVATWTRLVQNLGCHREVKRTIDILEGADDPGVVEVRAGRHVSPRRVRARREVLELRRVACHVAEPDLRGRSDAPVAPARHRARRAPAAGWGGECSQ